MIIQCLKSKTTKRENVENSHSYAVSSITPPLTEDKYFMSVFGILPEFLYENRGTCKYMFKSSHFLYKGYSAIHFLLLVSSI